MMRLRHIEIFHAIYTTGSITNAAKILHVSQPSVSKVLAHAEMQLGFNLFERVKGRLLPTEEAEMLFGEVDKIYQQMRSIKNTATNIRKSEFGHINLGLTPALGFDVLPKAVARFHQDYPNVNINIQTLHNDDVLQALLEHKCDMAILFSPSTMANVKATTIDTSELVIVYPKALFPEQPKVMSLADICNLSFIDIGESGPLGDLLWSRMMEDDIQLNSSIKVQTYFIAARLVAQGAGVCIIDKYTALGNLTDDIGIASFAPKLRFNVDLLHLESNTLSKVASTFVPYLSK